MSSFSFDRLCKVFRWLLSVNWLVLLGVSSGCAVSMFLLEMVTLILYSEPSGYIRAIWLYQECCGLHDVWHLGADIGIC